MKRLLIAVLVVVTIATMPAGASPVSYDYDRQELPTENTTATPTPAGNQTYEAYIDGNTRIVRSEYNGKEGTATVVIESSSSQIITLADGGALASGESGVISTTSRAIEAGNKMSISVPVTESGGLVAVTITTDKTLYGHVFKPPSESVFERTTARDGWIGGATAGIAMFALAAYRVKNSTKDEPEEIE